MKAVASTPELLPTAYLSHPSFCHVSRHHHLFNSLFSPALSIIQTITMTPDHPVFKRLSRQQLVIRRRSVGFQVLTFTSSIEPLRCRCCGRDFNATWKALLCHVCGLWTCESCSRVIERERDMYVIRFVRACASCMSLVNKWPDPALLTSFADAPTTWVVQCSKSQLALNLADALRSNKSRRDAVLTLLQHLNPRAVAVIEQHHKHTHGAFNQDWGHGSRFQFVETIVLDEDPVHHQQVKQREHSREQLEQLLVQQCFDVSVPELALEDCVFAEADGVREYPVFYDEETETPLVAPEIAAEDERSQCLAHYDLTTRDVNTDEMALICELAAKELDAMTAFISVIQDDEHRSVACRPESTVGSCGVVTKRSQTLCAFALTAQGKRPFLVRDAVMDFRFRNLQGVVGDANIRFYVGFPILSHTGVYIASFCVVDANPRKYVTTMQYSIIQRLAEIVADIWKATCGRVV